MDNAIIRCTLVTSDEGQRIPHAHRLVRREDGIDSDDPHHIKVSPALGFTATYVTFHWSISFIELNLTTLDLTIPLIIHLFFSLLFL